MASSLTTYGANEAVSALFGSGTFYVGLHTADPGAAGSTAELAAANGYARQAATFSGAGGTFDNVADVVFGPATADQGTVTHFSVWDAVTAGNCIAAHALTASRAWPSGTLTFAAGDLDLTGVQRV